MSQRQTFVYEPELIAITYEQFSQALARLEYGTTTRVGLQLLAATGCRISELDHFSPSHLLDGVLYWRPGKNQKGMRREQLPPALITELVEHRRRYRCSSEQLLNVSGTTFVRYFDRDARPVIGGAWSERGEIYLNGKGWAEGWRLHLKGFRKTFQTILFNYFYEKYGEPMIAAEWVAKRMKHTNPSITVKHYISDHERIGVGRWVAWMETGSAPIQTKVLDFI